MRTIVRPFGSEPRPDWQRTRPPARPQASFSPTAPCGRAAAERLKRARLSKRLKLKPTGRWAGKEWTPAQLALVGTDHDEAVAQTIGRTRAAVVAKRRELNRPAYSGWPGGAPG